MNFNCHKCGACCLALGDVLSIPLESIDKDYREMIRTFPYKLKNGKCEKLSIKMECTIYNNRPDLCRVEAQSHTNSIEDYHKEVTEACKILMKTQLGMTDKEIS